MILSGGTGYTMEMRQQGMRSTLGSDFGFFPNKEKGWIVAKPSNTENVKEAFKEKDINITLQNGEHNGAWPQAHESIKCIVCEKVSDWVCEVG